MLVSSCGVKSDPVHPKGTGLPSILDEFNIKNAEDSNPNKKKKTNLNKQ